MPTRALFYTVCDYHCYYARLTRYLREPQPHDPECESGDATAAEITLIRSGNEHKLCSLGGYNVFRIAHNEQESLEGKEAERIWEVQLIQAM